MKFNTLNTEQVPEDEENLDLLSTVLRHLFNSREASFSGFGVDFGSKHGP